MKLDEKRKVIEVLLCASGSPVVTSIEAAAWPGVPWRRVQNAVEDTYRDIPLCRPGFYYADRQLEAAYRLIESSPTLRREWFGAR